MLKEGNRLSHIVCSSGDAGKSQVIKLDLFRHTQVPKTISCAIEPDDVIVLLTTPTGIAAFNIKGMTWSTIKN